MDRGELWAVYFISMAWLLILATFMQPRGSTVEVMFVR